MSSYPPGDTGLEGDGKTKSEWGRPSAAPTTVLCWVHVGLRVVLTLHNLALQSPFPLQIIA